MRAHLSALKLRSRFALLAAGLVLTVATVVGTVGYLTLRQSLLGHAVRTAQAEASRLAGLVDSSANSGGDSVNISDPALTGQLSTPGLSVEIDRVGGHYVQSTRTRRGAVRVLLAPAIRRRCEAHGTARARIPAPAMQIACSRIGPPRAPIGTVAVSVPLGDSLDTLRTLAVAMGVAVLLGTLLAALVSLRLARRALRPVRQMALTAETIRRGQLSRRVGYRGHDELGELAAVLNACFDELEEGIERQRRFGADASHELKTPLAAIRANVDILRGWGALDSDARAAALDSVDQASRRAARLVADLLTLAKLDREPVLSRVPVRLDDVVLRAVREAQSLAPDNPVRVSALDEVCVEGDPLALEQLLINLLDNALRVSPHGGEVKVALRGEGVMASIVVSDRGPGVPQDELERIFDRFHSRSVAPGGGPGSGAGLGLAIARGIARLHGGDLQVANRDRAGAVFTFTLPMLSRLHGPTAAVVRGG
ncbi:MAG TPA: HAMP domain-containing sensor histidine kinase [Solirubrobacteraceae bacterium]|nr:HAMP domain-containing sensor histidine kinase [Solirubrobacteraceae bacterium]